VKIFTARIHNHDRAREPIQKWLAKHGMDGIEITNIKEAGMAEF